MFIDRSKSCKQFLKRVTQRIIPVKLFQNLTCGFREEDFLRIPSWPYNARSPHSLEPCLWTDQNLARIKILRVLKRVTQGTFQWNYFKIRAAVAEEKIFKKLIKKFNYVTTAFLMESNSVNNLKEDLPRNISVKFGPNWPSSLGEDA